MATRIDRPERTRQVGGAYAAKTILMASAGGVSIPADGTDANVVRKITGSLLEFSSASGDLRTVRAPHRNGSEVGIAAAAITDLTLPVRLTATGTLTQAGATAIVGMPEATAAAGAYVEFRWII